MKIKLAIVIALISLVLGAKLVYASGSIEISSGSFTISEDTSSSLNQTDFVVRLNPKPTGSVTLAYSTDGQCTLAAEGGVQTTGGQLVSEGFEFAFTLKAVDDEAAEGNHSCRVEFSTTSEADSNFTNVETFFVAEVIDNNDRVITPTIQVAETQPGALAEGSSAVYKYKLVLNEPPEHLVYITAYGGQQCQLLVSQNGVESRQDSAEVVITPPQKQSPQITLIARQDDVYEGPHSCLISHSIATTDRLYSGVTVAPYVVPVEDDDSTYLQKQKAADEEQQRLDLLAQPVGLIDPFDGNNDGIEDSQQANVQTFTNSLSGQRNALVVGGDCTIKGSVVSVAERDVLGSSSIHFPQGLLEFTLQCPNKGAAANVQWLLDQQYPSSYPWLLRKVSQGSSTIIAAAQFSTFETQNGPVTRLSYIARDGGELDEDGQVNGLIVDPIGLGLPIAEIAQANSLTSLTNPGFTEAVIFSVIAIIVLLCLAWVLERPKISAWLHRHLIGEPSDKPRVDRF